MEAALDQRRAELRICAGGSRATCANAFLDLRAAKSQIDLASSNRDVAPRRFGWPKKSWMPVFPTGRGCAIRRAGLADLDYITALFAHNLAKLSLARALGDAEHKLPDYLKVQ